MHDVDARLGETIAALVRAARTLGPERLGSLLDDIAAETDVALMEERARIRSSGARKDSCGKLLAFPGSTSRGPFPARECAGPATEKPPGEPENGD